MLIKIVCNQLGPTSTVNQYNSLATFIRNDIPWSPAGQCAPDSVVEWTATKVLETTVVNVRKPPPNKQQPGSLPHAPAPAVHTGDFNCWNTDWGYDTIYPDGTYQADWAFTVDASLLFNPKEP